MLCAFVWFLRRFHGKEEQSPKRKKIMNVSNLTNPTTEPSKDVVQRHPEPYGLRVIGLILFSVIIFASLIGNALVLKAVMQIPKNYKSFVYYLVANLAVAEMVSSICQAFVMVYQEKYSWLFGEFACKLVNPLQVLAVIVVTSDLAAIAVYRYQVMIKPLRKNLSGVAMAAIIGGMWLFALALSLPLFVTRSLDKISSEQKICSSKFPGNGNRIYSIIRFTISFLVPYLIMSLSYGAVTLKLKRHIRENVLETSEIMTSSEERRELSSVRPDKPRRQRLHLEMNKQRKGSKTGIELECDLLRMIYVIIISFVVCYIPYQVLFLWEYSNTDWQFPYHVILRKYFYILTCLPSAIHPLCYGTMNRFFARAFSKIVMCRR